MRLSRLSDEGKTGPYWGMRSVGRVRQYGACHHTRELRIPMATQTDPFTENSVHMSAYEKRSWETLNKHWGHRANRRGLPNWASSAMDHTGDAARSTGHFIAKVTPEPVADVVRSAGDAIAAKAVRPAIEGAVSMLDLVNDWALELNDPKGVEKAAEKHGLLLDSFTELRDQDLKFCDRLLTRNTLTWRTLGAFEGAGMGLLALVPVAGIPIAITADVLVIQVLSTAIAAHIAYSYGYDAKDPDEEAFIQGLVRRSFIAQAAKAGPLNNVAHAANALNGRVNWSAKLRDDHALIAALEKLMTHVGPAGSKVSVEAVAKVVPFVGILIGAGVNSTVLAKVAADAKRYCQTRFLSDKYGLELPEALVVDGDEFVQVSGGDDFDSEETFDEADAK